MKKEIELFINSEHYYGYDNSDIIDYKGRGNIYKKRNKYYIIYDDENYNKARTTIRIEPEGERVYINRNNPKLKQFFDPGKKTKGSYITPYGEFSLEIETSLLKIEVNDKMGCLNIRYVLYLNGKYTSQNFLNISWDVI